MLATKHNNFVTKCLHLVGDDELLSLIRLRRQLRCLSHIYGRVYYAEHIRDVTMAIKRRISTLGHIKWNYTLTSFKHTDLTFWLRVLPPLTKGNSTVVCSDIEKAETLAKNFIEIHNTVFNLYSTSSVAIVFYPLWSVTRKKSPEK